MPPKEKKSALEKIKIAANKAMNSSVVKRWQASVNNFVGFTFKFGKLAGVITWMAISTLLVTALPLFLEMDREQAAIEAEKKQIAKLRQRGYTSQQISMLQAQTTIPM
ncbi:hypothetical protein WA171_004408, partial [Blastocystis sp. BT1]